MKQYNSGEERFPYRELIGSLMFLCTVTRFDLAYAMNLMSRFLDNHNVNHWEAAKRILKYLKGTIAYGILYRSSGSNCDLIGYCDTDFAGDMQTRKSTSGYVFLYCNGPISWCAQRQKIVTLSSTAAEYVSASAATREIVWLRKLFNDIGFPCTKSTMLNIDNQSAIQLVKNPVLHRRTKHIEIQYHFIKEKYECGAVNVQYVPSELQLADIFTKALAREQFVRVCNSIGLYCAKEEYDN